MGLKFFRKFGAKKEWRPVKHPRSLKKLGYDPDDKPEKVRHQALGKAVKQYGYRKTVQKLAFLKGAAKVPPKVKKNVSKDIEWLREEYGEKRRKK
jgi:hypothetical protein